MIKDNKFINLSRAREENNSNKTTKKQIGQEGEKYALLFLKKKGHKIVAKNYQKRWFEIDIISRKGNTFHFVEVKTVILPNKRVNIYDYILPIEQINRFKIRKILRGVNYFFKEREIDIEKINWQIDFLGLKFFKEEREIEFEYLEDIAGEM